MANMMSLNISDEVIKAAVQEEVNAGIVKALGNPEVIVKNAVKLMTGKYVNEKGEFCEKSSWHAKPYFDWLAEKTIVNCVKNEIAKYVDDNKDEFAKEIRKQLREANFGKYVTAAFLQTIVDCTKQEWKMPISITFKNGEEFL